MIKLSRFFSRLRGSCYRLLYHSGLIGVFSLIWFLLRTGTKPTRAIYPCQQVARTNIFVFGLPAIAPFWLRLRRRREFRLKVLSLTLITLFLAVGAFGFTRAKYQLIGWYQRFKELPKKEIQILAQAKPRVVWIRNNSATTGYSGSWWQNINSGVVDQMMEEGLKALTGQADLAAAWRLIIPGCQSNTCGQGKRVAIKVNLNSVDTYPGTTNYIDAAIEPVDALVRGLKLVGFSEDNIWVYDATRAIPDRLFNRTDYQGIRFYDRHGGSGRHLATFNRNAVINFNNSNIDRVGHKITDVVVDADYLIDMPVMKRHGGVTLSFKNHLGSISQEQSSFGNNFPTLHSYIWTGDALVKIYENPHIRDKTILIVGDGLFGKHDGNFGEPTSWSSFGGAPNSLFLSTDPVAADSIMLDLIRINSGVSGYASQYLVAAESAGLGVHETGKSPWDNNYTKIDLVKCYPNCPGTSPPPPTPTLPPAQSPTPTLPPPTPTPSPLASMLDVLRQWGTAGGADINGDGKVNGIDAGLVIRDWDARNQ